jgi:hypothetical protein
MSAIGLLRAREKMRGAGVSSAAIETFTRFYGPDLRQRGVPLAGGLLDLVEGFAEVVG